jgi:hypothetical protein
MDEGIVTPLSIAYFNGYSGQSPVITNFFTGSNSNLGLGFSENVTNSNWEIVLNREQDFENSNMRNYVFALSSIDGIASSIIVRVKNIFDSFPKITQRTNPCIVKVKQNF